MENLNYEGKDFEFWGLTGVVLSSEKRTETTAHQTQGRVNTFGNNLDVTMPTTTFSSVLKHDFWIKKEDGTEESISLSGIDIPLRPGQEVTMIYTGEKGKHGYRSVFVNHSAGKFWFINDAGELTKYLNVFPFFWKSLAIALITFFGLAYPLAAIFSRSQDAVANFAFVVAAGVLSYRIFVGVRRKLKFKKLLEAHLTSLARGMLKKT